MSAAGAAVLKNCTAAPTTLARGKCTYLVRSGGALLLNQVGFHIWIACAEPVALYAGPMNISATGMSILLFLTASAFAKPIPLLYVSPDKTLKVIVVPVGRDAGATHIEDDAEYECRVELYTSNGHKVWSKDFGSPDHDHGRGVAYASWSPDSKYFVFSTVSSGGHHPWQYFTYAYSRKQNGARILDDLAGEVIDPVFTFVPPDVISLKIFDRSVKDSTDDFPSKLVTVSLSKLLAHKKSSPKDSMVNPPIYSPY